MALLIRVLTVWPALAGLGVTIAIIPTTMLLGKLLTSARRESMAAADQRIKLMTEVITGVSSMHQSVQGTLIMAIFSSSDHGAACLPGFVCWLSMYWWVAFVWVGG
jgi:hypothetical protein